MTAMRRLLGIPFLFILFAGCPAPRGYHVSLTVTVPPEAQAEVSPSNPGIIMGHRLALGVVCQPSDVPFSVPFEYWISGQRCEQNLAAGYENMFVARVSDDDVAWLSANYPDVVLCGQSRSITDQKTIDALRPRAISGGWGPQGDETIAEGVGGGCDDEGDYTGTIVLNPLNP